MTEHLDRNTYSSKHILRFSGNIEILTVDGPIRHYLWRQRGWKVNLLVADHKALAPDSMTERMHISMYTQNYESWIHAAVRATYYRIHRLYHNFKYRGRFK